MAFILADRVRETASAPGTGTVTLLGAVTGYQTFSAGIGANNTTYYVIADQSGTNWEVGLGTIGAGGTTLARTTVLSSSNSGSLVNFSSGTQDVFCDYPAGKAVYKDASNNVTGYAISGGTIDNTPIGATTASTGAFTYASTNSTTSTTPTLSFNGSNTSFASGSTVANNYLQAILQNKSGTAGASTNYVLSNDLGTDSSYYGEFGMNSSVYSASTPSDFFSINNGVYFSGHDGDITVGSGNGFKTYMAWGTTGQSAHVINASGALGLSTNLGTTPALSGTTGYGTSGQVLTSAGSAAAPTWTTPSNGSVTSVAATVPSFLSVSGSPITTSGTLALTYSGTALPVLNGGTGVTTSTGSGSNVLNTSPTLTTPAITGGTISNLTQELIGQSYDQGTGVLQVTGQSTFNGAVTDKSLNLQGGNNLVLNSATLVTQNSTVTATTYTLSMTGTGTITLSGTSSGTLVGTGASTVVSKTFTPTAGTLTLTPTGSCTTVQLELGSVFSGYTATTGTAITTTNNISVPSGQVFSGGGITATTPAYSFTQATTTGLYLQSTNQIGVSSGGSRVGYFASGAFWADGNFGLLNNGTGLTWNGDTSFLREAANTLAQRNSTNAQTFRLYNTYTDASNYERLSIDWSTTANTATIVTQNAGTGSARNLAIGQDLYVNSVRVGLGGGAVSSNTAVGSGVLTATATGTNNTGGGFNSLNRISSGASNTSWGANCLYATTTGIGNSSYGVYSLYYNNSGSYNTSSGVNALFQNTTASNLTAVGAAALQNNTTNVATLGSITGGTSYTNGTYTGVVMTLSSGSTAITYPTATIVVAGGVVTTVTLTSNGVGFKDTTTVLTAPATSIGGTGSGFSVPVATLASGTGNVAVGYQAGYTNSVGSFSTLVGYQAGYSGTTGGYMSAFGYQAGYSNTTGSITAFGWSSCQANTTGINNSGFGFRALQSVTTTNFSSAFGDYALQNATGGSNSAYGKSALQSNTSGANNTAIGAFAGYNGSNSNTTGSYNTYLGAYTVGSGVANTNEMAIGYGAVGLGSNTTVIGNSSTTLTKAFGVIVGTNYTVATLPSASTSGVGARAFVTDALAPSFGVAVTGGGAVPIPVYSTGSAWNVG